MAKELVLSPLQVERPRTLLPAVFQARPNRFIAELTLKGEPVRAHVPDPGRLKELLTPGVDVLVDDFGPDTNRKLRYSLELVKAISGYWVSLNTQLPNRLMKGMIEAQALPWLKGYTLEKPEVRLGESRIDFLLRQTIKPKGQPLYIEVKSCTLVEESPEESRHGQRQALFPDAPTVRGARHVRELIQHHCQSGDPCCIVFVVQRPDADFFSPNHHTDPAFASVLQEAHQAGLPIYACCFELLPTHSTLVKEIPIVFPR